MQPASGDSKAMTFAKKQLAVAALLIEVATADHILDEAELTKLSAILEKKFALPQDQLVQLTELAKSESADSTSLYQFTQLVNSECSHAEKFELIKAMWDVAYTDMNIDKYEEYIIRKVADLIHVSHSDFIRAKKTIQMNNSEP